MSSGDERREERAQVLDEQRRQNVDEGVGVGDAPFLLGEERLQVMIGLGSGRKVGEERGEVGGVKGDGVGRATGGAEDTDAAADTRHFIPRRRRGPGIFVNDKIGAQNQSTVALDHTG